MLPPQLHRKRRFPVVVMAAIKHAVQGLGNRNPETPRISLTGKAQTAYSLEREDQGRDAQ